MKNTFLFIRHGESTANAEGLVGAQNDVPLTARGRSQASQTTHELKDKNIAIIISSALVRAKETALTIASLHDINIEIWKELNEVDAGTVTGTSNDSTHSFLKRSIAQRTGESLEELEERANNVIKKLKDLPSTNKLIIIVGHNTFTSIIFARLKDLSKEQFITHRNEWHMDNAKGLRIKL